MWLLVVVGLLLGNPSGLTSISYREFPSEKLCLKAVERIRKEIVAAREGYTSPVKTVIFCMPRE